MQRPEPIAALTRGLHQDALTGAADESDLAKMLLSLLAASEQEALRTWLPSALQTLTPAEMKGMLNRATTDIRFSSKGACKLLRAVAVELGLP